MTPLMAEPVETGSVEKFQMYGVRAGVDCFPSRAQEVDQLRVGSHNGLHDLDSNSCNRSHVSHKSMTNNVLCFYTGSTEPLFVDFTL